MVRAWKPAQEMLLFSLATQKLCFQTFLISLPQFDFKSAEALIQWLLFYFITCFYFQIISCFAMI